MLKSVFSWFGQKSDDTPLQSPPSTSSQSGSSSQHIIVNTASDSFYGIPSKEDNAQLPSVIRSSVVEQRIIPPVSGLLSRSSMADKLNNMLVKLDGIEPDSPRPRRRSE